MRRAVILFTRIPIEGQTKSRLRDFLTPAEILHVTSYLIEETLRVLKGIEAACFIAVTPFEQLDQWPTDLPISDCQILDQGEGDLGQRMQRVIGQVLAQGFQEVLLLGSDLYGLKVKDIEEAFQALARYEVVVKPTFDGGYGLIGLKQSYPPLFNLAQYGDASVLDQLIERLKQGQLTYCLLRPILDIDTRDDIAKALSGDIKASFYHQGVYNANFLFNQGQDLLRIAMASQMQLDQQIAYEFEALKLLAKSGVVPPVKDLVAHAPLINKGYLVESFLPGRPLDYTRDMAKAAGLLARIHAVEVPQATGLIRVTYPFRVMMAEFEHMFQVYLAWSGKDALVMARIQAFLQELVLLGLDTPVSEPVIINTELNAGNFLINEEGPSYVIDWEKPLIGDKEQDLAHFLAPTTTRWKTEVWLDATAINDFIKCYNSQAQVPVDRLLLDKYLKFTCCRGLTWCAMAKAQFEISGKPALDEATYSKVNEFLSPAFLNQIAQYIKKGVGT